MACRKCLVGCVQAEGSVMSDLRRIATFATVRPLSEWCSVSCLTLANCGFIYAGQPDHVVCQRCGVEFSGWLAARRNPAAEHRCPRPSCTETEDIALTQLVRVRDLLGGHRSTAYDMLLAALKRAARSGVLLPTEARDLTPTTGRTSATLMPTTTPHPLADTPSHDDVSSDDTVTSDDSHEATVLRLTLSLAEPKRHCPCCLWRCWQQHLGIWSMAACAHGC